MSNLSRFQVNLVRSNIRIILTTLPNIFSIITLSESIRLFQKISNIAKLSPRGFFFGMIALRTKENIRLDNTIIEF